MSATNRTPRRGHAIQWYSNNDSESAHSRELSERDVSPMGARDMSALMQTVTTMNICYELFKSWDEVLKEPSTTRAPAVEEVHDSIKELLDQSLKALGAAKKMLDGHCQYSHAIGKALEESCGTGRFQITRDMKTVVANIRENARIYSDTVALTKDILQGLTDQLDRAIKQAQKKSWWQKLLGWVTRVFKLFKAIFSAGIARAKGQVSGSFAEPVFGPAMSLDVSLIGGETIEEQSKGLLQFLKYRLKNEISEACERLSSLNNCYTITTDIMYESSEETLIIDGRMAKRMKQAWSRQYAELNEFRERVAAER